MAQQTINVGAAPNDGTGTPLRTAFQYTNSNFTELYTAVGPSGNNIVVPGTATITGDLTVATDRLKVVTGSTAIQTGATTQLQVGTTSWPSTVIGKSGSRSLFGNTGEVVIWSEAAPAIGNYSTLFVTAKTGAGATTMGGLQIRAGIENASNSDGFVSLWTSNSAAGGFVERYKIDSTGVSTWSVAGTTAMTLNSTGLGIGIASASISAKLHIDGNLKLNGATSEILMAVGSERTISASGPSAATVLTFKRWTSASVYASDVVMDGSGNVGISVTPSAWTPSDRALQFAYGNSIATATSTNFSIVRNAQELAGGWTYSANGFVQLYNLESDGAYKWYTAASGTASNPVSFGSAKMTLDTLGNLILLSPSTPPTLATNGQLTVNATSNTNLRFSYRGSDGVTRTANLTLA